MKTTPVILDTNIYISYLLSLEPVGVVTELVQLVFEGHVIPAIAPEQILELSRSVQSKTYLRDRIPPSVFAIFLDRLLEVGIRLEPLAGDLPQIFRDPRDDYLYAYAVRDGLDIIVSGDRDVLAERGRFVHPRILTPGEFREWIRTVESSHP